MYSLNELCGINETNTSFKNIKETGEYIFENDPDFNKVNLYDKFFRKITVNSYDECEHYVLGGWDRSIEMNIEFYSQNFLLLLLVIVVVKKKIFNFNL